MTKAIGQQYCYEYAKISGEKSQQLVSNTIHKIIHMRCLCKNFLSYQLLKIHNCKILFLYLVRVYSLQYLRVFERLNANEFTTAGPEWQRYYAIL